VLENKVEIESEYFMAKAPQYRYTHQEMYIKVSLMNYPMPNVYENFTMRIVQNGRKDNVIVKHQPKMITNDYLYFNFPNDILFEGGNEYRTFDTRSLKTQSARINSIGYTREGYRVTLLNDQSRLGKNYLNYTDLNGDYAVITWDDSQFRNQIESDYTFVDFSFELDSVLSDGGIYLMGELSNWRIDNSSRMEYNSQEKKYTKTLLLKQGYYDYHYLYVPNGKSTGRLMPFEGSFSETDNSYSVFVYYRDQGQLWDRLIGYENVKTK
jgi:hypothetical protein